MANQTLVAQLEALSQDYPSAVVAGLEVLKRFAQENAPVRTGELRDSAEIDEASGTLAFTAKHAGYVEYGTSRMPARPFLRKAIDEHQGEVLQAMADVVNAEMEGRV